ncbi:MAG: MEDS domain-containing protein [Deltaproteobacteria bacterium]|nr:MEDS domain-containing protein [Deltaproteobacteria bacterium]
MQRIPLAGQLGGLQPHDHLCLLHGSEAERLAALVPFVRAGLEAGESCLCTASPVDLEALRQALASSGVDVAAAIAAGGLLLRADRDLHPTAGRLDPDAAGPSLEEPLRQALAAGRPGLRLAGDVAWAMGGDPGPEALLATETRLQEQAARHPLKVLCLVDGGRLSAASRLAAVRSHPLLVEGGRLSRNPYFEPPEEALAPDHDERRLRRMLRQARACGEEAERVRHDVATLRLLADRATDLIYRYRLGPEPGFEYVSPSALRLTGYTPEEHYADPLLGQKLVHPEDREKLAAVAAHSPDTSTLVLRWIRKDGSEVVTEQRNVLVRDAEGRPVALEGVARDVTESERARRRLFDAQRLAAAGTVAGALAHEINGPLAWIGTNLGVLREALDKLPPEAVGGAAALEELRACLGDALDGTARVKDVIAGLRALRQVNGAPDGAPADVAAEVALALETVRPQAESRAALEADLPHDLPHVAMPAFQLSQVLMNLLFEVLQRIPEGRPGEHWIRVSAAPEPGKVRIDLADSGPAMGPELQRRLFEPLFGARAEPQGLRLALCHLLVSSAGGSIEAESGQDGGTRLRLHLPVARAAP